MLTDASLRGWDAVWKGKTVHGKWNSRCSGEHINVLEVRAVHLALLELLLLIWNRHLLARTDHLSVVILTGPFKILLTALMWLGDGGCLLSFTCFSSTFSLFQSKQISCLRWKGRSASQIRQCYDCGRGCSSVIPSGVGGDSHTNHIQARALSTCNCYSLQWNIFSG